DFNADPLPLVSLRHLTGDIAPSERIKYCLPRLGQKAHKEIRQLWRKARRVDRQACLATAEKVLIIGARVWHRQEVRRYGAAVVALKVRADFMLRVPRRRLVADVEQALPRLAAGDQHLAVVG